MVLAAGDSFHLIPRMLLITTGKDSDLQKPMGLGKQITSITMTIFYLLLMNIGLVAFQGSQLQPLPIAVYVLSAIRIILCLMPQNRWCECQTSNRWSLIRNIPFLLIGILIAYFYFINRKYYWKLKPYLGCDHSQLRFLPSSSHLVKQKSKNRHAYAAEDLVVSMDTGFLPVAIESFRILGG